MIDGKLFTSYCWFDNVSKPVLYPVFTSAGTEITRGFPLKQRAGERNDHPHQIGIWLTYGNVDGNDFWGNGSQGLGTKNANGGIIKNVKVDKLSERTGEGVLVTSGSWADSTGNELLSEHSEYHFIAEGSTRIIDRITTLTATGNTVTFKDTKEGMFGIRVARQLELPSKEDVTLTDAQGNPTTVKALSNEGVTGNYISSEGIKGEAVWSTRARWMDLYGSIGDEKISLVVCDHPKNQSYPTYWHARGYGLFAANPFGAKDFTEGKEELNHNIPAGGSLTLKYRIIVNSGSHLTDAEINAYADEFAKKY
ncbi:MAG: PmoA family protein [Lentimicrobiaceae bacterium]|nr:PmoA family protein [Lentimicrobiaceae bacterium]